MLDEVHRLAHPSELRKIAADHYPDTRVVATGSPTLSASRKFRDTLAGRKVEVWLTPMIMADLEDFGRCDFSHRFLQGGLLPFFIAQSGGLFEATKFARPCEVSRTTIANYLAVLEATFVVHVVRPFSSYRPTEMVSAPKVYGFDTDFVCYHRDWRTLQREDLGLLWEHVVLNELYAHRQAREVRYWHDKCGHEVDFVLARRGYPPLTVECTWSMSDVDPTPLVVAHDVERTFSRTYGDMVVRYMKLPALIAALTGRTGPDA